MSNNLTIEKINFQFKDLGRITYDAALQQQEEVFEGLIQQKAKSEVLKPKDFKNTIFFCEHEHVYTLGKNGQKENLLLPSETLEKEKIQFFYSNRGGDITYHGPGQLTVYPVLDLDSLDLRLGQYIRKIEELLMHFLAEYGITAHQMQGAAGVWIENNRKIAAIGVKSSRNVVMHGFALNVNIDLKYFDWINACGFVDKKTTSMQTELKTSIDFDKVKIDLKKSIEIFLT